MSTRRTHVEGVSLGLIVAAWMAGCSCDTPPIADAGPVDASEDTSPDTAPFDAGPRPRASLEGELMFAGCTPAASDVVVSVRPIDQFFDATTPEMEPEPSPATVVEAQVEPTADPHVLRFHVDGLTEGDRRQIGVQVDDPSCPDLTWRGPPAGLMMAGQPARFDGLVRSSRLEVRANRSGVDTWVSRDFVHGDAMMRRFRWSTDLDGVTGFDIQFSRDRFDVDALEAMAACAPPEGLLLTQTLPHSPIMANEIDIDLVSVIGPQPAESEPLARAEWEQIRFRHAPIYARIIPRVGENQLCDPLVNGVSSWVELVIEPEEPATPPMLGSPPVALAGSYHHGDPAWLEPHLGAICYTVVTPNTLPIFGVDSFPGSHDVLSWNIVSAGFHPGGYTMPPGESFCYWPPSGGSSSFFDDMVSGFSDLVTGIVDAVSAAVDAIAQLYESIKNIAIDLVAHALAGLVGCPGWCHDLVRIAAESALVAMGLPPSLPNFDQLAEQGIDYLAAEVATQIGVPDVVVGEAFEIAVDMIERARATRGGSSGGWSWAVEDTGFRAPTVILDVRRTGFIGTPTHSLWVDGSGPWYGTAADLHTPALGAPALRMPMVLSPNYDLVGIAPPAPIVPESPPYFPAYYGHRERVQAYYQLFWFNDLIIHSCVGLWAIGMEFGADGNQVAIQTYADLTRFNTPGTFEDPFGNACTP